MKITCSASLVLCRAYLGHQIKIIIDRPLGSKHPKHGFFYPVNYGYVPGTKAPDGAEVDAYFLGADKPLKKAKGLCIAIIHRQDNDDDKLVLVTPGQEKMTDKQILKAVHFQEKWFISEVLRR